MCNLILSPVNYLLYHSQRAYSETSAALYEIHECVAVLRIVRPEAAEPAVPAVFTGVGGYSRQALLHCDAHEISIAISYALFPVACAELVLCELV